MNATSTVVDAIQKGKLREMVSALEMMPGFDINSQANSEQTLLMLAIESSESCANELLFRGADPCFPNEKNTSFPLFEAARLDKAGLALVLISNGACLKQVTTNGFSPLDISQSGSLFRNTIQFVRSSDIPLIMLRDSIINQDSRLLEAAIDLEPDYTLFNYNGLNIMACAVQAGVGAKMILRLIEQGMFEWMNHNDRQQVLRVIKRGEGDISVRQLFRYGYFAKLLIGKGE